MIRLQTIVPILIGVPLLLSMAPNAHADGYAVDGSAVLYEVSTKKKKTRRIGKVQVPRREGKPEKPILTDLALSPEKGMYGISYSTLYKIDVTAPERSKRVGALRVPTVNALCFDGEDRLWAAGGNTLYRVDLTTGRATSVGRFGVSGTSDGDLVMLDGALYLTLSTRTGSTLVRIDPKTARAKVVGVIRSGARGALPNVWGLILDGSTLYALTPMGEVYVLDPKTAVATAHFKTTGRNYYGACPRLRL